MSDAVVPAWGARKTAVLSFPDAPSVVPVPRTAQLRDPCGVDGDDTVSDDPLPDRLTAATRELCAMAPADFTGRRTELVRAARAAGDRDLARAIAALRKPTVAAWIVNFLVQARPDTVGQLFTLRTELVQAQNTLDAPALRELSGRRRALIGELTHTALTAAGRSDAPAALRDEVTATLDAALADPDVAARLGILTHAQQWSGFGVAPSASTAAPALSLVSGGRSAERSTPTPSRSAPSRSAAPPEQRPDAEQTRAKQSRAEQAAIREECKSVERDLAAAQEVVNAATERLARAERRLATRQRKLDAARAELDQARVDAAATRDARAALAREQQQACNAVAQAERTTTGSDTAASYPAANDTDPADSHSGRGRPFRRPRAR